MQELAGNIFFYSLFGVVGAVSAGIEANRLGLRMGVS